MAIETLGEALRQIDRLFADGTVTGLSDAQLLDRFVGRRDVGAFEAILARHGPMVLSVCRGVLRDPNDAEDAFQATFLVMLKKAGTIRGRRALGGWLYQVAHRVAVGANKAAARRRACEKEAGQMAAAITASGSTPADELLRSLHEEIARLPERYRHVVVLCDMEGKTQAEAALELDWSERTLRRRLAEARERLKARPARRGLAQNNGMLAALFLRESRTVVPVAWGEATVRAAIASIEHMVTAGAVSAGAAKLSHEVLQFMLVQKLKLALAALVGAGLMVWGASVALISAKLNPKKWPCRQVRLSHERLRFRHQSQAHGPNRSTRSVTYLPKDKCSNPATSRSPCSSRYEPARMVQATSRAGSPSKLAIWSQTRPSERLPYVEIGGEREAAGDHERGRCGPF